MKRIKRYFLLLISILCLGNYAFAQTPTWNWAEAGIPNKGSLETKGISTDASGNVYAAIFGITMGGVTFGNYTLPSEDMYLVKYNKQGKLLWTKHQPNCYPNALSTDAAGNTYVTGKFRATATIGATTLICKGVWDMFVAKYDSAGNALWARQAGGPGLPSMPPPIQVEDQGNAIAVDTAGNCYVGGVFFISNFQTSAYNYVTFDTITYSLPASFNNYKSFGFLAKYNAAGQIQWMRRIEAQAPIYAIQDIAVSSQGDCYLAGSLYGTLTLGNRPPLISNGSDDVYYARFDPSGNPVWAKSFGGSDYDYVRGIAVNKQGECFLTGSFSSANLPIGTFNLIGSAQRASTYLVKCDSGGNVNWASQISSSGSVGDPDVAVDTVGNAYVSAWFTGTVNVGQQTLTASNVTYGSPILSKWSSAGTPLWAITAQGGGIELRVSAGTNANECYMSGTFIGSIGLGNHFLSVSTASGFFLAKLSSGPTGIAEGFGNELSFYPNPAQKVLHLNFPETKDGIQLQLTDVHGKTVFSWKLPATAEAKLELPDLAKGIYVLTAQTGKQVFRRKFVIQ